MTGMEFRVWIGCLACYNNGFLIGNWYDGNEAGEVTTKDLHAAHGITTDEAGYVKGAEVYGPHEELWCFDVEAPHRSLVKEMSPSAAQEIADALADLALSESEVGPFLAWVDDQGYGFAYEIESWSLMYADFEEAYAGEWDNQEDFAYELAEDIGAVPKEHSWPASYIDWKAAARDLFMDYTALDAPGGRIWVYRNH